MKKTLYKIGVFGWLCLCLTFRGDAARATSLDLGNGWSLAPSLSNIVTNNPLTAVDRDYYNGMWLVGYGVEAVPIMKTNSADNVTREVAFIGLTNTFAVGDHAGQGVFGVNVGIHMPTAILQIYQSIADSPDIISQLPPWAQKINQYTALDGGAGDRIFGVPDALKASGVKALALTLGVYCNIPVGQLLGVPGSL